MEKVAKLLFELASVERLDILAAISSEALKHSQIAKKFEMTTPETSRHLERLTAAKLVAKNNNGEYTPTTYARMLLSSLPFFRFLIENQEYLSNHDLTVLPTGFFERLGDLEGATYLSGVSKITDAMMKAVKEAKRRAWGFGEGWFLQYKYDVLAEKASEGIDVRYLAQKGAWPPEYLSHPVKVNFEIRGIENVPFVLGVYDDFARISFPGLDGKLDTSIRLVLQTPRSHRWAEELYLHFWDRAEKLPYQFTPPPL